MSSINSNNTNNDDGGGSSPSIPPPPSSSQPQHYQHHPGPQRFYNTSSSSSSGNNNNNNLTMGGYYDNGDEVLLLLEEEVQHHHHHHHHHHQQSSSNPPAQGNNEEELLLLLENEQPPQPAQLLLRRNIPSEDGIRIVDSGDQQQQQRHRSYGDMERVEVGNIGENEENEEKLGQTSNFLPHRAAPPPPSRRGATSGQQLQHHQQTSSHYQHQEEVLTATATAPAAVLMEKRGGEVMMGMMIRPIERPEEVAAWGPTPHHPYRDAVVSGMTMTTAFSTTTTSRHHHSTSHQIYQPRPTHPTPTAAAAAVPTMMMGAPPMMSMMPPPSITTTSTSHAIQSHHHHHPSFTKLPHGQSFRAPSALQEQNQQQMYQQHRVLHYPMMTAVGGEVAGVGSFPHVGGEMETLCLGGELVAVPQAMIKDLSLFRSVLTKEAFYSLSEAAQHHLRRFLPQPITSRGEEELALDAAFTDSENFCFGSPLTKVHEKIQGGYFARPHSADEVQLRDHRRVLYDHFIRNYYMDLMKKLMISRQILLDKATKLRAGEHPRMSKFIFCTRRKLQRNKELRARAKLRVKRILAECKAIVGENDEISTDDEVEDSDAMRTGVASSSATATLPPSAPNAQSTLYSDRYSGFELDLHQPIRTNTVAEMLREYRQLRERDPESPCLDIADITLEEVYERAGISFQSERNFALAINGHRKKTASANTTTPAAITPSSTRRD